MTKSQDHRRRQRLESFRAELGERVGRLNIGWINFEQLPSDAARSDELLRELHTLKGEAAVMGFATASELVHVLEEVCRDLASRSAPIPAELGDHVLQALDTIIELCAGDPGEPAQDITDLLTALRAEIRGGDQPTEATAEPGGAAGQAPRPQASSLRVRTEQLDRIRDIIGELLLTRIRMSGSVAGLRRIREAGSASDGIGEIEGALRDDVWRMANLTSALEGATRELRMVPVAELFARCPLIVRTLAQQLDRRVVVATDKESAEVDREILEALADPMLHLLRNAVDHGIEPPEERARAGKPMTGTVRLNGEVVGGMLRVEVTDDGAGVDIERVRRRAVALGQTTAAAAAAMSREEVHQLLFAPRMTTREQITQVSGRGIGLDIVREKLNVLGGSVQLTSELGRGTTFTISVPVTTSLKPMVLFYVGDARFALPASAVETIVLASELTPEDSVNGPSVLYDGQVVPLLDLRKALGEEALGRLTGVRHGRTIIAQSGQRRIALIGSFGHQQRVAMVKTGAPFRDDGLASGGVALEDGTVALVLNIAQLVDELVWGRTPRPTPAPPGAGDAASAASPHTVLVVDDSEVILDVLVETLRAHGLNVVEATNGVEALARIEEYPEIKLVVTDLEMPRMDGFELIRTLRARKTDRRIPAVVVSTRGSDEDKRAAIAVGADAYLVKSQFATASLWNLVSPFLN